MITKTAVAVHLCNVWLFCAILNEQENCLLSFGYNYICVEVSLQWELRPQDSDHLKLKPNNWNPLS